ncbi:hypothetical protein AVEN_26454-1 [Araneus ventricosus]|uniref:Uncharacterized protein n=1 Tax=Araneus ventricosus TaxID=182803 RepID=A0A4Y2HY41_ARAVE|nr:hypothetical protein AVEN_26454-1 [Araneus ventricosus]
MVLSLRAFSLELTGNITKVLHNFLQNRTLQVLWRNSLSRTKPVQKGLPQGRVVSPILFVCFLADFSETLDPDSNFSLQQACHKFVMTRVQACSKLTKAPKSP